MLLRGKVAERATQKNKEQICYLSVISGSPVKCGSYKVKASGLHASLLAAKEWRRFRKRVRFENLRPIHRVRSSLRTSAKAADFFCF